MSATCPICGSPIRDEATAANLLFEGATFRFCSQECLRIFQLFPDAYGRGREPELNMLEDTAF